MKIKKSIEKIPGGMMIVPLFLGVLIRTLFPNASKFFGGFTGSYLTGTSVILFVWFLSVGTTIDLRTSGYIAKKGLSLLIVKVLLAGILGVIASHLLPVNGIRAGVFSGLSVLAIIASFNETNGGLYAALMTMLNRKEDAAGFPFISIESGPFMTMITMGVAGIASFPWPTLVSTIIPFAIGIILGTLDKDFRKLFGGMVPALIPFFAVTLGFTMNFGMIIKSGFMGIIMGVAGAAVAVPFAIAQANPQFLPTASSATAIVATSVLVSALITPFVTMYFEKRARAKGLPIKPAKYDFDKKDEAKLES